MMRRLSPRAYWFAAVVLAGCGPDGDSTNEHTPVSKLGAGGSAGTVGATGGSAGATSNGGAPSLGGASGAAGAAATGGTGGAQACTPPSHDAAINRNPPEGAEAPAPPSYSGGQVPAPVYAPNGHNQVTSGGLNREFILVAPDPSSLCAGEQVPLVFYWHALGEEPDSIASDPALLEVVKSLHLAVIVPVAAGATVYGFDTRWPFDVTQTQARMDQEYEFFDDMYVSAMTWLPLNRFAVGSYGVSAGAFFNAQLQQARSKFLASSGVIAGGTGGVIRAWNGATRKTPTLVAWGGPSDVLTQGALSLDFHKASLNLEAGLTSGGHSLIECIHDCGHHAPNAPPSAYMFMYRFLIDHPLWLPAGESPYGAGPLPQEFPVWCGLGMGSAKNTTVDCD